ncbi:MAG TPA: hypothetical protein VFX59_12370 [Polyangiales bacterium]|nr:hypothetical protein [Polyangiales bacterium]
MTIWRWAERVLWLAGGLLSILWLLGGIAAPSRRPGFPAWAVLEQQRRALVWYESPIRWLGTRAEGFWFQIAFLTTLTLIVCLALTIWRLSGRTRPWLAGVCATMCLPVVLATLVFVLARWGYVD